MIQPLWKIPLWLGGVRRKVAHIALRPWIPKHCETGDHSTEIAGCWVVESRITDRGHSYQHQNELRQHFAHDSCHLLETPHRVLASLYMRQRTRVAPFPSVDTDFELSKIKKLEIVFGSNQIVYLWMNERPWPAYRCVVRLYHKTA